MYSQNNEDEILKDLIPKQNGYFVDIGACDPKWLSNSRFFANKNWKLFMLEMNPFHVCNLLKEYKHNNNVEIMAGLIIETNKKEVANCYLTEKDAISTIFSEWKHKWETGNNITYEYNNFSMRGITCLELANYIKTKTQVVDIVSVDVEGNSSQIALELCDVLEANCYIVEHDSNIEKLREKFNSLGYDYVTHNPENVIFVKREIK